MKRVRTERLNIQYQPTFSAANKASADVWNECLSLMEQYQWRYGFPHARQRRRGYSSTQMQKDLSKSQPLHSQSIQAVCQAYYEARASFFALMKSQGVQNPRPPRKRRNYRTTLWKKSAISFVNGATLRLSMGKGRKPILIPLPPSFEFSKADNIATVELVYKLGQWSLRFTYSETTDAVKSNGTGVVGVDIGEIHPLVTHDGTATDIYNGRYIRSLYRQRNKVSAAITAKIARCRKHSRRWWALVKRKWKWLKRFENQIRDCHHKHTRTFVNRCIERGIGTIVLGDLTGIRKRINYGKRANQKLHQWSFGKIKALIIYKARDAGIKVVPVNETYTSQTCPACGGRKKPTNRNYRCGCGFEFHRDGVGAINIRQKYLGRLGAPVEASMIAPVGIRIESRRCSSLLENGA